MWPLQQYQPAMGAMQQPSYGQQYQNNDLMQAMFKQQTLDQLLGAFTPANPQQGGPTTYLDMLMQGMPSISAPSTAPAAAAPAAAEPAKPADNGGGWYNPYMSYYG